MNYLLVGRDKDKIKRRIEKIKEEVYKDFATNTNVLNFFLSEHSIEEILRECNTYPIFGNKKVITIFEIEYSKELLSYLEEQDKQDKSIDSSFVILILVSDKGLKEINKKLVDAIKKYGKIEEYKERSIKQAKSYLESELKELISNENKDSIIDYIVERIYNSESNLNTLVERLKGYAKEESKEESKKESKEESKEELTFSDVKMLMSRESSATRNIFSFTNSLFEEDVLKSLRLLDELLKEKNSLIYILTMIYRQLKLVWTAKGYNNSDLSFKEIVEKTKLHPFVLQQALKQALIFEYTKLEMLIHELSKLDKEIRVSVSTDEAIVKVELYIMLFARG